MSEDKAPVIGCWSGALFVLLTGGLGLAVGLAVGYVLGWIPEGSL